MARRKTGDKTAGDHEQAQQKFPIRPNTFGRDGHAPPEFYLSNRGQGGSFLRTMKIGTNSFTIQRPSPSSIGKITDVAVKTVEKGTKRMISRPLAKWCRRRWKLWHRPPERQKRASHLKTAAGHYGISQAKSWRENIRPLVLKILDENQRRPRFKRPPPTAAAPAMSAKTPVPAQKSTA